MEKQPPSEAAISSSGLVPIPYAKRVRKEYWILLSAPLSVLIVPLPSRRLPFQTADALRSIWYIPTDFDTERLRVGRPIGQYFLPWSVMLSGYRLGILWVYALVSYGTAP